MAAATIVCTVVGGAIMSGNTTHRTVAVPAAQAQAVAAAAVPAQRSADRLAELRGASRVLYQAPPPAAVAVAPVAERTVTRRAERGRTRSAVPRTTRAQKPRKATKRRPPSRPVNGAGYATYSAQPGVVGFALAQVGKGYSFGSTGPDRYDCSGLVVAAYRLLDVRLPRSTYGLATQGRPVSRAELRPGDLVFPSSGHVGIYIGNGQMVHASTERDGVKISGIYAFAFARRLIA